MSSFQEVIKEDIQELISNHSCLFCNKRIALKNLAGFNHSWENMLDLKKPICFTCWNKHNKKNPLDPKLFSSLGNVLLSSEGDLTDEVELIDIKRDKSIENSDKFFQKGCQHEYKVVGKDKLECRHCYKKFSLKEE